MLEKRFGSLVVGAIQRDERREPAPQDLGKKRPGHQILVPLGWLRHSKRQALSRMRYRRSMDRAISEPDVTQTAHGVPLCE